LTATGLGWREFFSLLTGLLAADTRLFRHFKRESEPDEGGQP